MDVVQLILSLVLLLVVGGMGVVLWRFLQREAATPATRAALDETERRLVDQFEYSRRATSAADASQRQELHVLLKGSSEALSKGVEKMGVETRQQLSDVQRLVVETLPGQVEASVKRRFESDFKLVRETLQQVTQRLTTLEALNKGVDDLTGSVTRFSQMLGNVKARGTWGEYQLEALLTECLAPGQFEKNVHPNPRSQKRMVEFAIALPGAEEGQRVWLPIDSKFPQEDYERLLKASEEGDRDGVESLRLALVNRVKKFATEVRDAYVVPPYTTDFAILFLPTEGLYLELLRHPGLVDELQTKSKILLAGPTTLGALLSALRLGFRTLAVQKNTVAVMKTLQRVKQALEGFERQHEATLKSLQSAVTATEKEASRLRSLRAALQSVDLVAAETSIIEEEEETRTHA